MITEYAYNIENEDKSNPLCDRFDLKIDDMEILVTLHLNEFDKYLFIVPGVIKEKNAGYRKDGARITKVDTIGNAGLQERVRAAIVELTHYKKCKTSFSGQNVIPINFW